MSDQQPDQRRCMYCGSPTQSTKLSGVVCYLIRCIAKRPFVHIHVTAYVTEIDPITRGNS